MLPRNALEVSRGEVEDGSWLDKAVFAWSRGTVGVIVVEPEPSGDAELHQAIGAMLDSNGTFQAGDRAIIHARQSGLAMGCEAAHVLLERDISATVVLGLTTMAREAGSLLDAARAFDAGSRTGTPQALAGMAESYRSLLEGIERDGRGHWIVPLGTSLDPDPADVPALDALTDTIMPALAPTAVYRRDGRICSHDMWFNPTSLDVERLNEDLPEQFHWTLDEWRSLVFRAMAVSAPTLYRQAMAMEATRAMIQGSLRGGRLRYRRGDGTDISFRVENRPVVLDVAEVGESALEGTGPYHSIIVNQPTTEVFVPPIEDSLDGVIVFNRPQRMPFGVIRAPYRIEVASGQVTAASAPDEESLRLLRHYVGLEPYSGTMPGGDEGRAFRMRRTIAEVAISGFNPVLLPQIRSGRLRPVTGNPLLDEKLGDHQAFGANEFFKGSTPSSVGGFSVLHTDFIDCVDRTLTWEPDP